MVLRLEGTRSPPVGVEVLDVRLRLERVVGSGDDLPTEMKEGCEMCREGVVEWEG